MSFRKFLARLIQKIKSNIDVTQQIYAAKSKSNNAEFQKQLKRRFMVLAVIGGLLYIGSSMKLLTLKVFRKSGVSLDAERYDQLQKYNKDKEEELSELRWRELRFYQFASVEYNGQLFMTPKDFLESDVKPHPTPRLKRIVLTDHDLEYMKRNTPKSESKYFFRNLKDQGIISFTEYLFLLAALTKPRYSFEIAFKMFDTDGNHRVDRNEFLQIGRILAHSYRQKTENMGETRRRILSTMISQTEDEHDAKTSDQTESAEQNKNAESNAEAETKSIKKITPKKLKIVDTTLLLHFFGSSGDEMLTIKRFCQFVDNLQFELCSIEFNEFAKGNLLISELDFATILLRYTKLSTQSHGVYLHRLLERIDRQQGISLHEFCSFMRFLNHLDDFLVAIRMYTKHNQAVDKDTLRHIIRVCTGTLLSKHLIDTVFALFDIDGDGYLSYEEFIAIMRHRAKRGIKAPESFVGWNGYKRCFRKEYNKS